MTAPNLFGQQLPDPAVNAPGKARHDHPETAKQAAAAVIPRSGTARHKVLLCIAQWPRSDEQIQDALSMPANTERPRRVELQEMGWIEPHPDRITHTRSGQAAIVWRLTEYGAACFSRGNEVAYVQVAGDVL